MHDSRLGTDFVTCSAKETNVLHLQGSRYRTLLARRVLHVLALPDLGDGAGRKTSRCTRQAVVNSGFLEQVLLLLALPAGFILDLRAYHNVALLASFPLRQRHDRHLKNQQQHVSIRNLKTYDFGWARLFRLLDEVVMVIVTSGAKVARLPSASIIQRHFFESLLLRQSST